MSVSINIGVTYNGRNIRKSFSDLNTLRKQADTTGQKLQFLGAQMQLAGRSASAAGQTLTRRVTAPLAAVGFMAVKSATEFESSFAKIQGLVGVAAEDIAELEEAAARLGPQFGRSSNEAAEALFFITSAGLEGAEAIAVLEASLKASAVGLGDTATVADLVTSSVNAYGSAVLSAAESTDVLTNAVRLGKLEPEDLAGSIGMVLPLASAMGVEFHEVGAAFAAMSRTGTDAATAGTQLRQILATLTKPTAQANTELEKYGLSAQGLRDQLRERGLLSVLDTLTTTLGGNDEAISRVFGNIRALSGVLDLMGSNVDATRQIFDGMADSTGTLDEAFAVTADTAGFQFQQALSELREELRSVGETLLPIAQRIVGFVQNLADGFSNLSPKQQDLIIKFAGIAALAGPVLLFFGNLITAIGLATIALGKMSAAAALATGGLSLLAGGLAILVWQSASVTEEQQRLRDATRDNRIEQEKLNGVYGEQARLAAEARRQRRLDADAARYAGQAAYFEGGGYDYLAGAKADAAAASEEAVDPLAELEAALNAAGEAAGGSAGAGPKVVALTDDLRAMLQELNETYVGAGDAAENIAQFAREVLAAGNITDDTVRAAESLAQAIRRDIDESLREGNQRLEEATRRFEAYRDAIAGGISQGNTLSDAVRAQSSALDALSEAERRYEEAQASGDPKEIEAASEALDEAQGAQKDFLGFLQVGVDSARGFAAQIDALREAGASMRVVQQIAELGARTGGRVAAELLAGGAAAIAQANAMVAAVEDASRRAGEAAAQQFFGAGVNAARQFVRAIEETIPELQGVLDRIADAIERAMGTRPDVSLSGERTFLPPPAPSAGGGTTGVPAYDPRVLTESQARAIGAIDVSALENIQIPMLAAGGVVTSPTLAMIGEAGPEAVIPLDRGYGQTVVNVTVTSADPQAVVEAIRRYTRNNGPLGQVVSV